MTSKEPTKAIWKERNQNFIGQDYRPNCECCDVVRENIDDFLLSLTD